MITVYTSLQSLLGSEKLTVIEAKDLALVKSGDIVISIHNNPYLEALKNQSNKIFETGIYQIYAVE